MPFLLILIGLMLVIVGVRDTQSELFGLLQNDFALPFSQSYLAWVFAIGLIGGLGYFKSIRPITNAFLVLVIVVLFLSNKGVFSKFISQTSIASPNVLAPEVA